MSATWFVSGNDWPALSNDIPIDDIYGALCSITDDDVAAAGASLLASGPVDSGS